ncbi:MAG: aspartate aminotransferase family protein [Thermoproteota archaeon]|nr:MAG: aspartate aminotransferase family protein [Candidatus Korarchaeota archaeon]
MQSRSDVFIPFIKPFIAEKEIVVSHGKGAVVYDTEGNSYIDMFGMHSAAVQGYSHPKIVEAVKRQAEKIMHVTYDFATEPSVKLAEKLIEITPEGLNRVYLLNSGAEADEAAVYTARRATGRYELIALYGAFHGRTYGARSLIGWRGYKTGGGPFLPGVHHMPSYYCYRCSLGLEHPGCNLQCARLLSDVITYQTSGEVAAFVAEPMQGTAGNIPAPSGYFTTVKKILDEYEILLIDDEVITGFARTGRMFAIEHYGVTPDIMVVAKALGGGLPVSAIVATEDVASKVMPMDYFTTFGGNPLAAAAALAAIEVIEEEKLVERSQKLGDYLMKRLRELQEKHELIGDVRGKGLLIGVELVKDRKTKEPAREESYQVRVECLKRGVIMPAGMGWLGNVIRMNPPLVITEEQIDKAVDVLDEALKAVG